MALVPFIYLWSCRKVFFFFIPFSNFYEQSCLFVFLFVFFSVKIGTSEPKSRLREISKEVAQRAGELRGLHLPRRDPERSSPRRLESRHRGTDGHQHQRSRTKGEPFPSWSSYITFPSSAICHTGDYVVTSLDPLYLSLSCLAFQFPFPQLIMFTYTMRSNKMAFLPTKC